MVRGCTLIEQSMYKEKARKESMLIRFNSITNPEVYTMYRTVYCTICAHINTLNSALELNAKAYAIVLLALKLYNYTFIFEGYTDCLYDLRIINDIEYNSFYEFCKAIRLECNPFM